MQEQTRDEADQSVELLVFEKRNRWASVGHVFNMRTDTRALNLQCLA